MSTTGNIFAENCERYWAKGLPVMPLKRYTPDGGPDGKPTGKEPVVLNWQSLQSRMPTETERTKWKIFEAAGNIGLPLGPQSKLIAIDIDSDDEAVLGVIDRVLPLSPWRRVGQKGKVLIYRYDGQPIVRIRHKQADGKMGTLIEMLGAGSQIVLPPSIHPKTGKPYYANCELLDVLDRVPSLPPNAEALLRDALTRAGFQIGAGNGYGALTEYVSAGGRDNSLTAVAGICARDVTRGQRTLLEAMQQVEAHNDKYLQKTYGDNIDPEKGPKKLLEFLFRDVTGPKRLALPRGWDDGLTPEQRKSWGVDRFTEDHEGWDGQRIADYLVANVDKAGVKTDYGAFMNFATDVLGRIAANSKLPAIEEDGLIQDLARLSGKRLTVAAARRQVAEMRRGPITGANHAEVAQLVLRDLQELGGEIRYDNEILWQWQGDHWERMDEALVVKHIVEEYGDCKAATRANDHQGILKTLRYKVKKPLVQTNERGINFVNGYLTEDLTLKPHNPDFGMTYVLPYAYEPAQAGKATRWQRMLFDYWGQDPDYSDKVTALGELMALTMFGKMPSVALAVLLYGVANSGKSRIIKVMEKLMPADSWCSLPPTMWGDKFGPAQLVGKLLNIAGELAEHQLIDGAKFKQIVSGEVVDAQFKNGQLFNFYPKAAHWFASNFLPKSRDSSSGFTRRWIILSFNRKIEAKEDIKDYEEIVVAEEREAIVAWAVAHIARLRCENYRVTDPQSSKDLREVLENELNTVRAFLVDLQAQGRMLLGVQSHTSIPETTNYTTFPTLWTEYRSYCVSQGVTPVGSKGLEKRMTQLQGAFGFKIDKVNGLTGLPIPVYRLLTLVDQRKAA